MNRFFSLDFLFTATYISQAIATESSLLHIVCSRTLTGSLSVYENPYFPTDKKMFCLFALIFN